MWTAALEMLSSILDIRNKDKKIYLDGGLNMLSQPEFQDVNKVKTLLHSLEQQEVLSQLMEADNETGITVKIGAETGLDEVKDCSVIVANYKVKGKTVGKVGLLVRQEWLRYSGEHVEYHGANAGRSVSG